MSLPVSADYVDLVQNPRTTFYDPELQKATASVDGMGLPRAYSGNFAVAFRMVAGMHTYAVRCFTRDVPEVQRRYDAISRFCDSSSDAALCSFEYQARGIAYCGGTLPIVKMEWAEGERLDKWLAASHDDARGLRRVAEGIANIAERLEWRGAAHGDLQHGNLIITSGFVRLIDYDGMFVPSLSGLNSPVLGHSNYQHPRRTAAQFDSKMDRFSILVLFVGLNALAADRMRYVRYGCDERVLFDRADFENPDDSNLFHELSRDAVVGDWALALADVCRRPPSACPALSEILDGSYLAKVGPVLLQRKTVAAKPRANAPPPPPQSAPGSQPQQPQPRQTFSAMPPPYMPYVLTPASAQRSRGGFFLIAAVIALAVTATWHPWSPPASGQRADRPASGQKANRPASHRQYSSGSRAKSLKAASHPVRQPPVAPARIARRTPSPRRPPIAVVEHVVHSQHQPDSTQAAGQSATSVASQLEDMAQRGRVPVAAASSAAGDIAEMAQHQRQTCTAPDADATPTSLVNPETPESLQGRSAVADVRVSLDANGRVLSATITRTTRNSDADAAALVAARASAFRAARKNCEATGGDYVVEFTFN